METPRVRLGELLVRAGLVSNAQLEEALVEQRRVGKRLGSLLVETGLVSETQVTQILSQQLSVPWVSLHHIDFSRDLLKLVTVDLVERYCLIPIYVRRVRGLGDALYIAMDDPTNAQALNEVGERSGLHVRAMIAPPSDIRNAIRTYYGVGQPPKPPAEVRAPSPLPPLDDTEEEDVPTGIHSHSRQALLARAETPAAGAPVDGPRAPANVAPLAPPSPPRASTPPISSPRASTPPSSPDASRSRPGPSAPSSTGDQDSKPEFQPGKRAGDHAQKAPPKLGRKMIALTLLDGTTINVPAKGKRKEEPPTEPSLPGAGDRLTARDIVAALRAAARGVDASEIIGEKPRWEAMFAALLSSLLRKHLISDQDFLDELEKS